jgi:tetratricopeptide (TPR) repeat protein
LLAENKIELDLAKTYAEKAVAELEASSAKQADRDDYSLAGQMEAAWDTLGWIYLQLGDLNRAESYLRAAWSLGQQSTDGYHLGQVYERLGRKTEAIHVYSLAMDGEREYGQSSAIAKANLAEMKDIRARYEKLAGKPRSLDIKRLPNGEWSLTPSEELKRSRQIKISNPTALVGSAEFSVVFSEGKVEAVRYISGDEALRDLSSKLTLTKFKIEFPGGSKAKIVRQVGVSCAPRMGCDAELQLPTTGRKIAFRRMDIQ